MLVLIDLTLLYMYMYVLMGHVDIQYYDTHPYQCSTYEVNISYSSGWEYCQKAYSNEVLPKSLTFCVSFYMYYPQLLPVRNYMYKLYTTFDITIFWKILYKNNLYFKCFSVFNFKLVRRTEIYLYENIQYVRLFRILASQHYGH